MAKPDWKQVIGAVAPSLATALGGPLAGVAVRAIAEKVLGKSDASEEDVAAAVAAADPALLVKIKELDLEFKKSLTAAGIQLEKIASDDRVSARLREINAHDSWTPRVLATIVLCGFLWCVYAVLGGYIADLKDPMISTLVGTMIGYMSAKADQVVSYYFGSSASSKDKDKTISDIAKME